MSNAGQFPPFNGPFPVFFFPSFFNGSYLKASRSSTARLPLFSFLPTFCKSPLVCSVSLYGSFRQARLFLNGLIWWILRCTATSTFPLSSSLLGMDGPPFDPLFLRVLLVFYANFVSVPILFVARWPPPFSVSQVVVAISNRHCRFPISC